MHLLAANEIHNRWLHLELAGIDIMKAAALGKIDDLEIIIMLVPGSFPDLLFERRYFNGIVWENFILYVDGGGTHSAMLMKL
jgi:hypothetical protein